MSENSRMPINCLYRQPLRSLGSRNLSNLKTTVVLTLHQHSSPVWQSNPLAVVGRAVRVVGCSDKAQRVVCGQVNRVAECTAAVGVDRNKVAVGLAWAVLVGRLNQKLVGIVEGSLEVDRPATGLVQATWVGSIDGLSSTLSTRIVIVERGVGVRVARRQRRSCSSKSAESKGNDGSKTHDAKSLSLVLSRWYAMWLIDWCGCRRWRAWKRSQEQSRYIYVVKQVTAASPSILKPRFCPVRKVGKIFMR